MNEIERVERRNISIYPSQWAVVDSKAREIGDPENASAGLRALIAEYVRLKAAATGFSGNGGRPEPGMVAP